jgi:hypothetical protein
MKLGPRRVKSYVALFCYSVTQCSALLRSGVPEAQMGPSVAGVRFWQLAECGQFSSAGVFRLQDGV